MARESMFGGFIKGAISLGITAAVGFALVAGAWPLVGPALLHGAAWPAAGALGTAALAAVKGGALWIAGLAAFGGVTRVVGNMIRDKQATAQYEASVERGQAMSAPGRARSQQHDFGAMGEAAGMNYRNDWAARTKGGAGINSPSV